MTSSLRQQVKLEDNYESLPITWSVGELVFHVITGETFTSDGEKTGRRGTLRKGRDGGQLYKTTTKNTPQKPAV